MIGVPPDAVLIIDRADAQVLAACVAAQIAEQRRNGLQPAGLSALHARLEAATAAPAGSEVPRQVPPLGVTGSDAPRLTAKQVAEQAGVSDSAVRKACREGRLKPSGTQSGAWVFAEAEATRWINERRRRRRA